MELTEEMLVLLQKEAREIQYGTITISLSEVANSVDITVAKRHRFHKKSEEPIPGKVVRVFKKG